jgi:dihydrolipoamide dehydrogenase
VVIGAGYIGLELGTVWLRLGAKVTVLEYLDRILPGMDSEIAKEAHKLFEKQGIEFKLKAKVTSAKAKGSKCTVESDGNKPIQCDRVLLATGRVPNTDDLELDSVKVELDKRGRIVVDDKFATSEEGIYAIGDVIAGPMLAHKAHEEGVAVAELFAGHTASVNHDLIPGVVYTHPEIAFVGQTEDQLKEQSVDYRKGAFPFLASGRALTIGAAEGRVKVLADAKTDRILGVHIIGPEAGDLINEAAAAMAFGASSEDLGSTCHAHPTLAESLKEAALAVDRRAIHI